MISLTKETIDNIFEPKREIRTAIQVESAVGRLLSDAKGRFFCLTKERGIDRRPVFNWYQPNRREPEAEMYYGHRRDWKKGTYPVWIQMESVPEFPLYEVLPKPIHQVQIILALYHIAFPDWDDIVKIEQYPRISDKTWHYIMEKCMAFDRKMHPDVIPGGAWCLGSGFSNAHNDKDRDSVPDWMIDLSQCQWAYNSTPFSFKVRESLYGDNNEFSVYYPSITWENGLRDNIESEDGVRRCNTLDDAKAACEKRAGGRLDWDDVIGPVNEWGDRHWQSSIVEPLRKAA